MIKRLSILSTRSLSNLIGITNTLSSDNDSVPALHFDPANPLKMSDELRSGSYVIFFTKNGQKSSYTHEHQGQGTVQSLLDNWKASNREAFNIRVYRDILEHPQTALVKGHDSYSWFSYTNTKPLTLKSQGGSTLLLNKGDKFGTRPSGNGKFIRLIGEDTGPTRVFTLAFDDVHALIQNCKPTKPPTTN